jgi:hypothetical protein
MKPGCCVDELEKTDADLNAAEAAVRDAHNAYFEAAWKTRLAGRAEAAAFSIFQEAQKAAMLARRRWEDVRAVTLNIHASPSDSEAIKGDSDMDGWYYLHKNGQLIYKRELGDTAADIRESDFALAMWPVDSHDREGAWTVLVEGLAAGASKSQVEELSKKWGCTDDDADTYAGRVGCVIKTDGNAWCAIRPDFVSIQESPCGFGETKLEAMADLCKSLGYLPQKMWGASFRSLLQVERTSPSDSVGASPDGGADNDRSDRQ